MARSSPKKICSLVTATYHVDGSIGGKDWCGGPTRMSYNEVTWSNH